MGFTLRPYQLAALDAVAKREHARGIVAMATGTGKTATAAHFPALLGDVPTLFLAHREELIEQMAATVSRVEGHVVGVERAHLRAEPMAKHVVASIPTLAARDGKRLRGLGTDRFGLIVVDECHHATSSTYLSVMGHFGLLERGLKVIDGKQRETWLKTPMPRVPLIGLTATPGRGDGVGLHNIVDGITFQYGLKQAIADGWLVPIRAFTVKTDVVLDDVHMRAGDYAEKELASKVATDARNATIFDAHQREARDLKTLVFCVDVAHAEQVAEHFSTRGVEARSISGRMDLDERRSAFEWFHGTPGAVLTNCAIVTEGVDIPSVECVVTARPTKSATLFCLSEDTEILTPDGWKGPDDAFREAYGFDVETGAIHRSEVTDRVDRRREPGERWARFDGPHVSFDVTDQHRMIWRAREGRAHRRTTWRIGTALEMAQRPDAVEVPVAGWESAPGIGATDDEMRFIGLVMTDGTIAKNGLVTISQSAASPVLGEIRRVLTSIGVKVTERVIDRRGKGNNFEPTAPTVFFGVTHGIPRGVDKHRIGWDRLRVAHLVRKEWSGALEALSGREVRCLLDGMQLGDGMKSFRSGWKIASARRVTIDRLQSLCVRRGLAANVLETGSKCVYLTVEERMSRTVPTSRSDRPRMRIEAGVAARERVWCVETTVGTLVTRRRGRVIIVGNCQMIGRGTRLAAGCYDYDASVRAGKAFMLLLDITDSTSRVGARAVNVMDIVGAPLPMARLNGEDVFKAAEQQTIEIEAREAQRASSRSIAVDLFGAAEPLPPGCTLRWTNLGGTLRLSLPERSALRVQSDILDRWVVEKYNPVSRLWTSVADAEDDQRAAIRAAERWALASDPSARALLSADARWHRDPPSEKQLELCKRKRIAVPEGATKGEIAQALDRYFGRRTG